MNDAPDVKQVAEFVTPDLKILIEGTDKQHSIKDKDGKLHHLLPLNLKDIVAFEQYAKTSILDIVGTVKIEHIAFLVYLSLRKEGLTREQIRQGQFKLCLDDVTEMFDAKFLLSSGLIYIKLLEMSGFDLPKPGDNKEKPENPPEAAPVSGQ